MQYFSKVLTIERSAVHVDLVDMAFQCQSRLSETTWIDRLQNIRAPVSIMVTVAPIPKYVVLFAENATFTAPIYV